MASPEPHPSPEWNAELRHIFISPGHDYWTRQGEGRLQHGTQTPSEIECVAGMGLRGDRYFGVRPDNKGQVTFFDAAVVEDVRSEFKLARLPASIFRRNLVVSGICLADWKNKRFRLQGVEFEGSQECTPCEWMDRVIAPGAREFLKEHFRGGLRAKVVTSGTLRLSHVSSRTLEHNVWAGASHKSERPAQPLYSKPLQRHLSQRL